MNRWSFLLGAPPKNFLESIILNKIFYFWLVVKSAIGRIITDDSMNPPPPLKKTLNFPLKTKGLIVTSRSYKSQNRMKGMNKSQFSFFFLSYFKNKRGWRLRRKGLKVVRSNGKKWRLKQKHIILFRVRCFLDLKQSFSLG